MFIYFNKRTVFNIVYCVHFDSAYLNKKKQSLNSLSILIIEKITFYLSSITENSKEIYSIM